MKEFKGTKGEWTINHWEHGEGGVTYCGDLNGVKRFKGDAICGEQYHIVSDLHPNDHNVEHSFEGAHIAEIAARSEESLANARLIAAAPELLGALQNVVKRYKHLVDGEFGDVDWSNEYEVIERGHDEIIDAEKAINKALGK